MAEAPRSGAVTPSAPPPPSAHAPRPGQSTSPTPQADHVSPRAGLGDDSLNIASFSQQLAEAARSTVNFIMRSSKGSSDSSKDDEKLLDIYDDLVKKSEQFEKACYGYPTHYNRISVVSRNLPEKKKLIAQCAMKTRILVHRKVLGLIKGFLDIKREFGTAIEQSIYHDMTVNGFIYRLISKRPLAFLTSHDVTMLRDGTSPSPSDWLKVGTEEEEDSQIKMTDYLTYDEMQISALLGVTGPTPFINNGNRNNNASPMMTGTFEDFGVYAGLVGARFERRDVMESQHILVTEHNTPENGFGADAAMQRASLKRLWAEFYECNPRPDDASTPDAPKYYFPLLSELHSYADAGTLPSDYLVHQPNKWVPRTYFNHTIFRKRMRLTLEPFFLDCNARGEEENKRVYVFVVGLGLGVWKIRNDQRQMFLDVIGDILHEVKLPYVSDVMLAYLADPSGGVTVRGVKSGEEFLSPNGNRVKIHCALANIADKLGPEHDGKLLAGNFAWDGNSFPGNEYWKGALGASGDPAAACCSCIPELHNCYVNPFLNENAIAVYGDE